MSLPAAIGSGRRTPDLKTIGRINSVESCGTVDGPGLRYVVFFSGCPLKCLYCHNPETRLPECATEVTAKECFEKILLQKNFLRRGGLTLSGGEPLAQPEFAHSLLHAAKENGIHTAIDTSGQLGHRASDELLSDVDLVLLDLKSFNPEVYKTIAGADVRFPLEFAQRLSAMRKKMWIRFVVVPGFTDLKLNVHGLAKFVASLKSVERVELLPFHKLGEAKYKKLGLAYQLEDVPVPTEQQMNDVREIFAQYGVHAR